MKYIGLIGFNSIEYVEKILKIWNDGDCVVLLDSSTPYISIIEQLNITNSSMCYVCEEIYEKNYDLFKYNLNIQFISFKSNSKNYKLLPKYIYDLYIFNDSHKPAVVIFSSGTTGDAKGIELSHYAVSKNSDMIYNSMNLDKDDKMFIIKKLSHSSTLVGELLVALRNSLNILIGPTIVPMRIIIKNIEEYKISVLCVNPTLLKTIAISLDKKECKISTIKKIFVSGDKFYRQDCLEIRKKLPSIKIYNMYGLTEAGPRVSMQNSIFCYENSVGIPLKDVEVKILNKENKKCESYEKGIIYVKTPTRFTKYVNMYNKFNNITEEWINTGDIGFLNEKNELFITDRVDDVIIINAHKIYPNDIENKILCLCDIQECKIIKKNKKNTNSEFLICVYVGEVVNSKVIIKELRNCLLDYEIPKVFLKIDSMPKNNNGKIDTRLLKKMIENLEV